MAYPVFWSRQLTVSAGGKRRSIEWRAETDERLFQVERRFVRIGPGRAGRATLLAVRKRGRGSGLSSRGTFTPWPWLVCVIFHHGEQRLLMRHNRHRTRGCLADGISSVYRSQRNAASSLRSSCSLCHWKNEAVIKKRQCSIQIPIQSKCDGTRLSATTAKQARGTQPQGQQTKQTTVWLDTVALDEAIRIFMSSSYDVYTRKQHRLTPT